MWYLSFWCTSLRMIISGPIQVAAGGIISLFFCGWVLFHCMYVSHFFLIRPSVNRCLGRFHVPISLYSQLFFYFIWSEADETLFWHKINNQNHIASLISNSPVLLEGRRVRAVKSQNEHFVDFHGQSNSIIWAVCNVWKCYMRHIYLYM